MAFRGTQAIVEPLDIFLSSFDSKSGENELGADFITQKSTNRGLQALTYLKHGKDFSNI